jgi:hypothetical protein
MIQWSVFFTSAWFSFELQFTLSRIRSYELGSPRWKLLKRGSAVSIRTAFAQIVHLASNPAKPGNCQKILGIFCMKGLNLHSFGHFLESFHDVFFQAWISNSESLLSHSLLQIGSDVEAQITAFSGD